MLANLNLLSETLLIQILSDLTLQLMQPELWGLTAEFDKI